jgi:hypothetical protein
MMLRLAVVSSPAPAGIPHMQEMVGKKEVVATSGSSLKKKKKTPRSYY